MKVFVVLACLLVAATATPFGGRITNGDLAKAGQFPYQVALFLDLGGGKSAFCGGSIIDDRTIISAAHCLDG